MRIAFLTLALITACLPALAVGKITTDPNVPGAAAPSEEIIQGTDTRLSKKVTIEQARAPLRKILDELTKSTGVVLKAGANNGDWQVRDRKMNIFAKDVPLAQLMNSISHVMKFKWQRKGEDGKWTYRLYMDRRTLLDAEAQRSRAEAKEKADETRRRQNALDVFGKLSSLSDTEKAKLKTDNPFLYAVSKNGWGDSLGDFLREVPAASEALASGQKTSIEAGMLSPKARTGIMNAMKSEMDMENRFNRSQSTRLLPEGLDPSTVTIFINQNIDKMPDMPGKGALLGEVSFRYEGGSVDTPFLNPDSPLVKWIGKVIIECEEQDCGVDDYLEEHKGEMSAAMVNEVKTSSGGEPENEHPDDPSLAAKVNLKPDSPALFNVEMDLANASKLCVVSDHFQNVPMGGMPPEMTGTPRGEMELKAALDKIGDAYVYNWDKRGSVIELRDRNWFRKRAAQIPDAWLEVWRNELETTGTIDLDSLSQIAQLTPEQYSANVLYDDTLSRSNLIGVVISSREVLRFYASLGPEQRASLPIGSGLDVVALSSDQSDEFAKLLNTKGQKLATDQQATMSYVRSQAEKTFFYNFKVFADGKLIAQWNLATAMTYKRPPEAKTATPPATSAGSSSPNTAPAK